MKINEILQPGVVQSSRSVGSKSVSTPQVKSTDPADLAVDQAEFHAGAKVESNLLEGAKLVFEAIPDVRADRVALAKQRLADGFYDKPEIADRIADRMVADPEAQPSASLSLSQQGEIRRKLAEGFYDSPEAIEKIAGGLIEDL